MVNAQLMIPAAGMGQRLGCEMPKALVDLAGRPMLLQTLGRFESFAWSGPVIVLCPEGHQEAFADVLAEAAPPSGCRLLPGGERRQDSVARGLAALETATEVVVIHDAARPFIEPWSVQASIEAARDCGAATVAVPAVDTLLEGDEDGFLVQTPERRRMWACQTPQTFRVEVIRQAHERAQAEELSVTDDATLVRMTGGTVRLVAGTPLNFKVTNATDLALAEAVLREGLL